MRVFRALLLLPCLSLARAQTAAPPAPPALLAMTSGVPVVPSTQTIDLGGQRYTRRETEFNPATGVTSIFFDVEGLPSGTGTEGIIINFYGWNPTATPQSIAETVRAKTDPKQMIFAFQAPDPITKTKAFFLISESPRIEQGYGYVNLMKVSSIQGSTYAVTYGRKIMATNIEQFDSKAKLWLQTEFAKQIHEAVDNLNITGDWKGSLGKQH